MDSLSKLVETYAADIAARHAEAVQRLGACDAAWQYAVRPTVERVYRYSRDLSANRTSRPIPAERGETAYRKGNADGRHEAILEAAAFLRGLPPQTLSPAVADAIATMIEANETIASYREV